MNVDLARVQFAFTSINHFFSSPVTIGIDSPHRYGGN
jgi:cytochrome bd-type quinol oxidase subunit 1